jgi:hypothetical protein
VARRFASLLKRDFLLQNPSILRQRFSARPGNQGQAARWVVQLVMSIATKERRKAERGG